VFSPDHVARVFELGAGARLTGTVERGEQGQIWQVETDRGRWAVKLAFGAPRETDGEDAAFQEAARAAGVPTPEVVRTGAGEVFADVGGAQVRVYGWVDVHPADRTLDPGAVGRLLARMHRVDFAGRRGEDPWYTEPVGAPAWDALLGELRDAGAPFAADLAAIRDDLVAAEAVLAPARDPRTCHRDLWADNLRATAPGGLCVIDWDNCGLADPGQEVACALFEFALGDAGRAAALYREYVHAGGPGRVDGRGAFSMAVAQLGHITEIACRRWLDPALPDDERHRQIGRVAECTAEPLTVEAMDALLAAVGPVVTSGGTA
jgi:Ser/Thr protein kinase RdoA (MazF antagonist)